ncbi:MAG: hypothetical protein GX820_11130 [Bacteroidales bacterium]|nr:hypothetical protein [Bacteroidales bacterium]
METKLTLRLSKKIIDMAKDYAHAHNISLSKMIESYLESITQKSVEETEISPLVESLSGILKLNEPIDFQKDYTNYLTEKYK